MDLKEVIGGAYHEDMTLADVEAALKDLNLVDAAKAVEGMVSKATFDKTAHDLAEAKKALKERLSTDEQSRLEREARDQEIMTELETLRNEKAVSQHVTRFLKLGYDEELAQKTAEAMVKQDFDTVFKNQQAFLAARDKEILRRQTLESDKRPPAGSGGSNTDFARMAQEAAERGDYTAQAYYLRMAQQYKG